MYLTRHQTTAGPRWALDGRYLPAAFSLNLLLELPATAAASLLAALPLGQSAGEPLLAPIEPDVEVWAAGVTYLRSRDARKEESSVADVYQKVYDAERPEVFFKSTGWRVVPNGKLVRIRADSKWNVPEPEMVLVINCSGEIVGYCAGNDMSSRDIEGENPLYLPQAKIYDGSCALGSGIFLAGPDELGNLPVKIQIIRQGRQIYDGESNTGQLRRQPTELAEYLVRELTFPRGVYLMTGTCVVPGGGFTLCPGDSMKITVGQVTLENSVE